MRKGFRRAPPKLPLEADSAAIGGPDQDRLTVIRQKRVERYWEVKNLESVSSRIVLLRLLNPFAIDPLPELEFPRKATAAWIFLN